MKNRMYMYTVPQIDFLCYLQIDTSLLFKKKNTFLYICHLFTYKIGIAIKLVFVHLSVDFKQ